jgi:hypothetical protein
MFERVANEHCGDGKKAEGGECVHCHHLLHAGMDAKLYGVPADQ